MHLLFFLLVFQSLYDAFSNILTCFPVLLNHDALFIMKCVTHSLLGVFMAAGARCHNGPGISGLGIRAAAAHAVEAAAAEAHGLLPRAVPAALPVGNDCRHLCACAGR